MISLIFRFEFVQSQLDDKDRTIRIQQNLISKLESQVNQIGITHPNVEVSAETISIATQTDRVSKTFQNIHISIRNE